MPHLIRSASGASRSESAAILAEVQALKAQIKDGRFDETALVEGQSFPTLLLNAHQLARKLASFGVNPPALHLVFDEHGGYRLEYLWALSWTADALEYFGDTAATCDLVSAEGVGLATHLSTMPTIRPEDRVLARQRVWVVLHYLNAYLYRRYEYQEALDMVKMCDRFVKTRLKDDTEFPCFYTRARIAAYRGAIERQLGDLDRAQRSYEEALNFIYRRLAREKDPEQKIDPKRIAQEETRASYEAAKLLSLGIAGCQLTQGRLRDARVNVQTALLTLSPSHDILRKAYAELLMGSIERAEAGFDVDKLGVAIGILKRCHDSFTQCRHKRYTSRADYGLSLAFLYRGIARQEAGSMKEAEEDFKQAEDRIESVRIFSTTEMRDRHWEAVALIVESRIARVRNFIPSSTPNASCVAQARLFAQDALRLAKNLDQDIELRLDSEVACGEAFLIWDCENAADPARALGHFEEALACAGNNPKDLAISHLHLAEAYLKVNNIHKALEHDAKWRDLRDRLDHGLVRGMGERISASIENIKKDRFVISGEDDLRYALHERRLREYLLAHAAVRYKTVEEIAASLGIKRATYYNWIKELRTGL